MISISRLPARPDWMSSALCATVDPEIFHPAPKDVHEAQVAKSLCRRCPNILVCLEYAIDNRMDDGIWAATTPSERQRLRREQRGQVAA